LYCSAMSPGQERLVLGVGQLAWLNQGQPVYQSVHSWAGQQASVGIQEINIIGFGHAARLHPRRDNVERKVRGEFRN